MKTSKSSYLDYSSAFHVSNSLAIREAITKISLSPIEAIKYLNGEDSIWSNTSDDAIHCALITLKKFYKQLKQEINQKTNNTIDSDSLLRFLIKNDGESISDVVSRVYGGNKKVPSKRRSWKQLKIADRDTPQDIRPIPSNVPPLDAHEFKSVSGWSDEEEDFEKGASERSEEEVYHEPFDDPLKIISARVLKDDEPSSSSSSSSSTLSSSLNPNERALKQTQKSTKNVFKIVHKVDKAISPRSPNTPKKSSGQISAPFSTERSGEEKIITSRYIPQSSKAIQTDFEYPIRPKTADVGVSARLATSHRRDNHERGGGKSTTSSITTSLYNNLIDKSSTGETTAGTTSSSFFSSSLSAGEIPIHKVAAMTAKSKYTVVSIRPDGSCSSAVANYRAFKETSKYFVPPASSSKTPTLMESKDEISSYHNYSSFANLPPLQASTPIAKSTTTFGVNKSIPRGNGYHNYGNNSNGKESDGSGGGGGGNGSSLRVQEYSLPSTSPHELNNVGGIAGNLPHLQIEELTPQEIREHLIRRHLNASPTGGGGAGGSGEPISMRSEEESTLNQVSPLPSGE